MKLKSDVWKTLPCELYEAIVMHLSFEELCILAPHIAKLKYDPYIHSVNWAVDKNRDIKIFKWICKNTNAYYMLDDDIIYQFDSRNQLTHYVSTTRYIEHHARYGKWYKFAEDHCRSDLAKFIKTNNPNIDYKDYIEKYGPEKIAYLPLEVGSDGGDLEEDEIPWYSWRISKSDKYICGIITYQYLITEKPYFGRSFIKKCVDCNRLDIIKYVCNNNLVDVIKLNVISAIVGKYFDILVYFMENCIDCFQQDWNSMSAQTAFCIPSISMFRDWLKLNNVANYNRYLETYKYIVDNLNQEYFQFL